MPFQGYGIYQIAHAHVANVCLAISEGSGYDGTPVIVCDATGNPYNQMWLVESVTGEVDTYTIRSLSTGLYVGLYQGALTDGTFAVGYKNATYDSMKWIIRQDSGMDSTGKIQNKGCQTFLDLHDGSSTGTRVTGWSGFWDDNGSTGQQWRFNMISRTSGDIHTALQNCPCIQRDFKSYLSDGLYLVLSRDQFRKIWNDSELGQERWRDSIFDCDDFATVFKAEVGKWGNSNFKADGFAILCGMMFGESKDMVHAYNWTLDSTDLSRVIFFEPQNGQFSNHSGYAAYFGLF